MILIRQGSYFALYSFLSRAVLVPSPFVLEGSMGLSVPLAMV